MARAGSRMGTSVRAVMARAGCTLALLGATLWAPSAFAYPMYDDGSGPLNPDRGCVVCHNGFQGGNGALHNRHRIDFAVATCNLCHPSGGGSTPVRTYTSGSGGGLGCAGCHGQDYGETSPNSGQPKATAYGLRQYHAAQGVTVCATCHQPGALGHSNPFPPLFPESVAPPYYSPAFSNLTDPCSSAEEDLPFDTDSLGLDNDGNGSRDYPADPNCGAPTTTTTTSTTSTTLPPPVSCGTSPLGGCLSPGKASLLITEKTVGKEKLKVGLKKLAAVTAQGNFGDPVDGSTSYVVCVYDQSGVLKGQMQVARAGQLCGTMPCWKVISTKGYKYADKTASADGITKIIGKGDDLDKGQIQAKGQNNADKSQTSLPTGIAAALQSNTQATVRILTSDASCFGATFTNVTKADGLEFKAVLP